MKIYLQIARLGLPIPEVQYQSPGGMMEPAGDVLARMVAYINAFSAIAEDDDNRFGKELIDDTREYLESECRVQGTASIFGHIKRRVDRGK